jgi:hypothetical protein
MRHALLLLALVGCKQFEDYQTRSKRTEAELKLNKLGKHVKVLAMEHDKLPVLTLGPTPDKPCCQHPGYKCTPDAAMWSAWQPLDFMVTDPFNFQYTYSSTDGTTFTATAIGDLDCDENTVVYKLVGTLENGVVKTTITPPTNTD